MAERGAGQGTYGAQVLGTGSYVPERVVSNSFFESYLDTTDEWIVERSGIKERRFASDEQANSDLSLIAANRALEGAGIGGEDIDLVIVATVTPDYVFPATASLIQNAIGAKGAAAFDISAGCAGFVYALSIASQFVTTGVYRNCLVIGCEVLSRIANMRDRNTCVLFGDGAGAVIVGTGEKGRGILSVHLGSDGAGAEHLCMPGGGSRFPATASSVAEEKHFIHMNGREVFKWAVVAVEQGARRTLELGNATPDDVDLFIPHQANIRIIENSARRLGFNMDKIYVNLERYGNTSAASIPIALDEVVRAGRVKAGDKILGVAFGAGLSWAGMLLEWTRA